MKILAVESSCDDTGAAVVEDGRKILSNVVASQIKDHIVYGGVVPEIASRMHVEAISSVVGKALDDAGITAKETDAIAVTYAPGLIGSLLVGVNFAKGLAFSTGKPLIPVHHLRGHIASDYLTYPDLEPPFLCLVVSGGHSHLVCVSGYTDFEIIGRTRDDAAGECMDKSARALGLDYPGGVNLDRVSKGGNPKAYSFPHPKVDASKYDFSFSGLKTAVVNAVHNASQRGEEINIADMGASCIDAVTDCLVNNLFAAADEFGYKKIALAGGVSANSVLRAKCEKICKEKKRSLYMPDLKLCGDNAAMIGSQGYYEYLSGNTADETLNAYATMPLDKPIK